MIVVGCNSIEKAAMHVCRDCGRQLQIGQVGVACFLGDQKIVVWLSGTSIPATMMSVFKDMYLIRYGTEH